MRKLIKIIRIISFKALEINKMIVTIQGLFNQEKWLNADKNSELGGILTCTSLIPLLQLH